MQEEKESIITEPSELIIIRENLILPIIADKPYRRECSKTILERIENKTKQK